MKKLLLFFFLTGAVINAEELNQLPVFDNTKSEKDWLISNTGATAGIFTNEEHNEIIISNGIISKRFRINTVPGCVSMKNLQTGEELIRAVNPEATLTINGQKIPVGGLTGQPNRAYLTEDWISKLQPLQSPFKFTGFETSETKEPFSWKRRAEWLSGEYSWPVPGKRLILNFESESLNKAESSKFKKILTDKLNGTEFNSRWKQILSANFAGSSCLNEGKAGEILTGHNTRSYISTKLPCFTKGIEVQLDSGTVISKEWGTGLTASYFSKKARIALDTINNTFLINDTKQILSKGKIEKGKKYFVRITTDSGQLSFFYSENGLSWKKLHEIKTFFPSIHKAEAGKDHISAKPEYSEENSQERSRCRINNFAALKPSKNNTVSKKIPAGIKVSIIYEIYDNMPVICKFFTITNNSGQEIMLNKFRAEELSVPEPEAFVQPSADWLKPNIEAISEMMFNGMNHKGANPAIKWITEPEYTSQVNYMLQTPCKLISEPPIGPAQTIINGTTFTAYRTYELLHDSTERERQSLAYRKMIKTLAPWSQENPLIMHVRKADSKSVKNAIDQCVTTGFEMVIMTFGSGFNAENVTPEYLKQLKELADYAHERGIALGGYSLLSSRYIDAFNNVTGVNPVFGNAPCLESRWGINYFEKLYKLFETTGLNILEHDGSYPGDGCRSKMHPGHKGYEDSQWNQWKRITDFYKWCRAKGIYLNIPDYYYLTGGSKCGMGYREVNWSLPRAQQEIHERQNIYDGTWDKTPSMGWMFVPLTEYHGGGAAATIEPLNEHLAHYRRRLQNLLGAGVQACFRGPRLYDTETTKEMVIQEVSWFKKYRSILESDIIHIRRPDGRNIDTILHVNPALENKGMLCVYNPLETDVTTELKVPLYYTGLTQKAEISLFDTNNKNYEIERDFSVTIKVNIPPRSMQWFTIK